MTSSCAVVPWQLALPPASAALGPPVLAIDDLGQAVGAGHGADDDVAAVAAVAAIGAALGNVLFAPEAAAAAAAVAAFDEYGDSIDEHDLQPARFRVYRPLECGEFSGGHFFDRAAREQDVPTCGRDILFVGNYLFAPFGDRPFPLRRGAPKNYDVALLDRVISHWKRERFFSKSAS